MTALILIALALAIVTYSERPGWRLVFAGTMSALIGCSVLGGIIFVVGAGVIWALRSIGVSETAAFAPALVCGICIMFAFTASLARLTAYVRGACVALALLASGDLPNGVTCESLRKDYARWWWIGDPAIKRYLRSQKYTQSQINAAQRCIKEKTS